MPVKCVPSNLVSDMRCAVCGQGYLLFSQRITGDQRAELRALVQQHLRKHHQHNLSGNTAHDGFFVELAADLSTPALA